MLGAATAVPSARDHQLGVAAGAATRHCERVPDDEFISLLPKLEGDFDAAALDAGTARDLVAYALKGPSDYWADLALNWVDAGVPASSVSDELRSLATAGSSRPQPLRHKAKRLIPTG